MALSGLREREIPLNEQILLEIRSCDTSCISWMEPPKSELNLCVTGLASSARIPADIGLRCRRAGQAPKSLWVTHLPHSRVVVPFYEFTHGNLGSSPSGWSTQKLRLFTDVYSYLIVNLIETRVCPCGSFTIGIDRTALIVVVYLTEEIASEGSFVISWMDDFHPRDGRFPPEMNDFHQRWTISTRDGRFPP